MCTKRNREIKKLLKGLGVSYELTWIRGHGKLIVNGKKISISGTPRDPHGALKKLERDIRNYC